MAFPGIQLLEWHAGVEQSPMREAEGMSRLHNTITDWPDD